MNMHRKRLHGLAAATLLGLCAGHAAAEPADGVLDPTFGDEGITMVAFDTAPANPIDIALDAVVDSFGRTYLVGVATTTDGQRIGITRLDQSGNVQTSYGPDDVGLVVAPEQLGFSLTGVSAALDADGNLLVGGTLSDGGNNDFALCRFDIDGSLEAFPNGLQCLKVAFDLGGTNDDTLRDIAVQSDGKIVMVGSAGFSAELIEGAIARIDTNGDLDDAFNGTGKQFYLPTGTDSIKLTSVAVSRNGNIVVGGDAILDNFTDTDIVLTRLLPTGALDTSFGGDGSVFLFPFQSLRNHSLKKLVLEPGHPQIVLDQQIVAVGSIETEIGSDLYDGLVARIDANGVPHDGFGTEGSGYRIDATGHDLAFNDMVREPNGNLLVAGTIRANSNPAVTLDYYVTRFLPNGDTDGDGFNPPSGFSLVNVSGSNDVANAIALQGKRIVVAGGSLTDVGPPPNFDFSAIGLLRDRIFANGFD
jgi:uncharacterized delta-60 repeat protein